MKKTLLVGPFNPDEALSDWPVYGCSHDDFVREDLGETAWRVVPFTTELVQDTTLFAGADVRVQRLPPADAVLVWSPEYLDSKLEAQCRTLAPYKVAFLGDWHIRLPDLRSYDLIATDWRGVQRLQELGYPPDKLIWWRGFSYDPRLHWARPELPERDIDIAFMGRRIDGHRDALIERIRVFAEKARWKCHIRFAPPLYKRGEEADIYRRARIVLNYGQRGELNMRTYEAAACGALSVLQHDAIEVYRSKAPIPTYEPNHLESFLTEWLGDDAARERLVAKQQAWVREETPARHLLWLVHQIEKRLESSDGQVQRSTASVAARCTSSSAVFIARDHSSVARHKATESVAKGGDAIELGIPAQPVETSARKGVMPSARSLLSGLSATPEQRGVMPDEPTQDEQRPEVAALIPASASSILDLGCGGGGLLWHLAHRPQKSLHSALLGIDADGRQLERAKQRGIRCAQFDCNLGLADWRKQAWYLPGKWDCVVLADVLEHLANPWGAAKLVKPLLSPDGCAVFSIPQIRHAGVLYELLVNGDWHYHRHGQEEWRGVHDNLLSWEHLRFFTKKTIEELFSQAGYEITRMETTRSTAPKEWIDLVAAAIASYQGATDCGWTDEATVAQYIGVAVVRKESDAKF